MNNFASIQLRLADEVPKIKSVAPTITITLLPRHRTQFCRVEARWYFSAVDNTWTARNFSRDEMEQGVDDDTLFEELLKDFRDHADQYNGLKRSSLDQLI